VGDRATLLLFTGRRVQKDYFGAVPGGIGLNKNGKAAFIAHLNERLDKTVRYPVQGSAGKTRNVKQREIIQHEAHGLANALLGRKDIRRVVETRELWHDEAAPAAVDVAEEIADEEEAFGP
jgi:CRISPR/Cas system-associated endonuclease Cas1